MRLCCAPFLKEASTSFVNKPIGFVSAVGCLIFISASIFDLSATDLDKLLHRQ
jgi:hypothetical protein